MGLIKAALGAAGGVLADQWKEYFYCDALDADVLAVKGEKRTSSRSSNRKGTDNVITSGSVIAVADGQCMMIPRNVRLAEAPSHGLPVTAYDRSSRGADAYQRLALEINAKRSGL